MRWFTPGRSWGELLLAIWLIIYGVVSLVPSLSFPQQGAILAALALASGILLLLRR
jgi:hypothetical protein